MSTLSSSSTLAEVQSAYDDNASYAEDASATKAAAFCTAVRFLLRLLPKRSMQGGSEGSEVELDPGLLRDEGLAAQQWINTHDTTAGAVGVRHADFRNFRE